MYLVGIEIHFIANFGDQVGLTGARFKQAAQRRGLIVLLLLVIHHLALELLAVCIGSAHGDGAGLAIG